MIWRDGKRRTTQNGVKEEGRKNLLKMKNNLSFDY